MPFLYLFSILVGLTLSHGWTVENCSLDNVVFSKSFPPNNLPFAFNEPFTSIELDNSTGARALDGSNYKFYFNPGRGSDKDKFMIYFQGGAFCGNDGYSVLESCYKKLGTMFGTSSDEFWAANGTSINDTSPWGSFSSIKEFNPLFADWNKVRILPLDGANYQGSLEEPLEFNGTKMWFRGFNNTMQTIEYLRIHHGLFEAKEIILSGGSAGGSASMVWASYLKDYWPSGIKISMILDGGLFLDGYSKNSHCYLYRFMKKQLIVTFNLNNTGLYKNCRYKDTDLWKCLLIEYLYEDLDYPAFFSNSQTDTFELSNLMGVNCLLNGGPDQCNSTERKQITYVRELFLKVSLKIKENKPKWGFWLRSCFEHSLQFCWAWYGHFMDVFNAENNKTDNIQNALYSWYLGESESHSYIDLIDWLHNPRCLYYYE